MKAFATTIAHKGGFRIFRGDHDEKVNDSLTIILVADDIHAAIKFVHTHIGDQYKYTEKGFTFNNPITIGEDTGSDTREFKCFATDVDRMIGSVKIVAAMSSEFGIALEASEGERSRVFFFMKSASVDEIVTAILSKF